MQMTEVIYVLPFEVELLRHNNTNHRLHKMISLLCVTIQFIALYRGADKSLARQGRKQATATEDFDFHVSYL
jgi:hypothetical protein